MRGVYIALIVVVLSAAILGGMVYWGKSFNLFVDSGLKTDTFMVCIDSDTAWSGTIGGLGSSVTRSGSGPANFTIRSSMASAVMQKQSDTGYLTVTILKNGDLVNTQTTTSQYETLTVTS